MGDQLVDDNSIMKIDDATDHHDKPLEDSTSQIEPETDLMSMRLYQELNKPENGLILTNIEAFYNENEQANIDEAGENAEVIPEPQTIPEMGLSAKTKKQRTQEKKKEL